MSTMLKLKDSALRTGKRKFKQVISERFSIEFKSDCLHTYFITNTKILHLKYSDLENEICKCHNTIDWECAKCVILKFYQSHKMIHFDFLVRKNYKFFKNLLEREEFQSCKTLCTLQSYYEA